MSTAGDRAARAAPSATQVRGFSAPLHRDSEDLLQRLLDAPHQRGATEHDDAVGGEVVDRLCGQVIDAACERADERVDDRSDRGLQLACQSR